MKESGFGAAYRAVIARMTAEQRAQTLDSLAEYKRQRPREAAIVDSCKAALLAVWATNPEAMKGGSE